MTALFHYKEYVFNLCVKLYILARNMIIIVEFKTDNDIQKVDKYNKSCLF